MASKNGQALQIVRNLLKQKEAQDRYHRFQVDREGRLFGFQNEHRKQLI